MNHSPTEGSQGSANSKTPTPTPYAFTARGTPDKQAFIYRNEPAGYATVARDLTEEDAAFIVRACNSHQALVEALEAMVNGPSPDASGVPAHESYQKARAALKLAKEDRK